MATRDNHTSEAPFPEQESLERGLRILARMIARVHMDKLRINPETEKDDPGTFNDKNIS